MYFKNHIYSPRGKRFSRVSFIPCVQSQQRVYILYTNKCIFLSTYIISNELNASNGYELSSTLSDIRPLKWTIYCQTLIFVYLGGKPSIDF